MKYLLLLSLLLTGCNMAAVTELTEMLEAKEQEIKRLKKQVNFQGDFFEEPTSTPKPKAKPWCPVAEGPYNMLTDALTVYRCEIPDLGPRNAGHIWCFTRYDGFSCIYTGGM